MLILGIDPGTTSIGYAVVDGDNRSPALKDCGLISITGGDTDRLVDLHRGINNLLTKWRPAAVSLEKLFFSKNVKTAMAVSEARGVILLTTALAGIKCYEYTPLEAKKVITGDGNADKAQMKKMVQLTLKETSALKARDDVFDAIGLALVCFFSKSKPR